MIGTREAALKPAQATEENCLLSLTHVTVAYETLGNPTLRNVSFSLNEGESVLFLGPSGCGKSTLAMLAANLIPSSVEAIVQGDIARAEAIDKPGAIGYVFQDPDSQFAMLGTDDEVAFGLENQRIESSRMAPRIREALREVGLDVAKDANHAMFSGGMKQKLAIACALAMNPELVILDEPTANLDPQSSRVVYEEIRRLHERRQTMILIEHKFEPILPYVDRVVLFAHDGTIYTECKPVDLYRHHLKWMQREGILSPWDAEGPDHSQTGVQRDQQGDSILEVEGATVGYKSGAKFHTVFKNLCVALPRGGFIGVIGPNGAGKSTLLQVLAGLERVREGQVRIAGKSVGTRRGNPPFDKVSFSFQNPEIQFIYERVADELANRNLRGEEVPEEVLRKLENYGLSGTEELSPFALSQGEKRRLSVAVMLERDSDVYIFDEPTFGQDAKTQAALLEKLSALNKQGKTIVLSTHDMALVREYCSQVVVVADGGILFQGTPQEAFANREVVTSAHLEDDIRPLPVGDDGLKERCERRSEMKEWKSAKNRFFSTLNPAYLGVSLLIVAFFTSITADLSDAVVQFAIPVVTMLVIGRMSIRKIAVRILPFLIFYAVYLFTFTANASVPAGAPHLHFLWMNFSFYGFQQGLLVAFRMLASVFWAIFFVEYMDLTDFVVSLCQRFRMPPKLAYSFLAGLRVIPLFTHEWAKLKKARQIRQRDARHRAVRPVTYALPVLAMAIRMSERVATAMEARGFFGEAAASSRCRTYYRQPPLRTRDFVIDGCFLVVTMLVMLHSHHSL